MRAQELRAQVKNIRWIEHRDYIEKLEDPIEKRRLLRERFAEISEAKSIAESTPGFDAFLKLLFLNNTLRVAAFCLEAGEEALTPEQIDKGNDEILQKMADEKYNHVYHPYFILNTVRFSLSQKEWAKAQERLSIARKVIEEKYPQPDLKKTLEELEEKLKGH